MSRSTISVIILLVFVGAVFIGIFAAGKGSPVESSYKTENIATSTNGTTTSLNLVTGSNIGTTSMDSNSVSNSNVNTGITMADVQKHNNASDCWTIVNNGVYDLTDFISKHPGGSKAVLRLCGIDGTSAFTNKHGDQKRPNDELAGLKIGELTK